MDDEPARRAPLRARVPGQVADWMRRAAERLEPLGVPMFVTGGNDDYFSIEAILDAPRGSPTPRAGARDRSRRPDDLDGLRQPNAMAVPARRHRRRARRADRGDGRQLDDGATPIFNCTSRRTARVLTAVRSSTRRSTRPNPSAGARSLAGSTAVARRSATTIPSLSLHGHIHESAGIRGSAARSRSTPAASTARACCAPPWSTSTAHALAPAPDGMMPAQARRVAGQPQLSRGSTSAVPGASEGRPSAVRGDRREARRVRGTRRANGSRS